MSKNAMPGAWMAMAGMAGIGAMAWLWGNRINKDVEAFNELVRDNAVSDPMEIWMLCCSYHKKLRSELVEAKARIEAGEEIVRVGYGLAEVRKMMKGPELDSVLKLKQSFGMEISEEEKSEALRKIQKGTVPVEVKRAIVAHWWTELMKLFVPWGLVLPDEIDDVKDPCFKLVGPEVREAVLRMEVHRYKEGYESFKASYERSMEREKESLSKQMDEREEWQKEREFLLEKLSEYESVHAKTDLDD